MEFQVRMNGRGQRRVWKAGRNQATQGLLSHTEQLSLYLVDVKVMEGFLAVEY